jgi:predicted MFS family arabinose efflux permease
VSSTSLPTSTSPQKISFARLIGTCISARLLVDIGVQMFNPFLPIFAAGLNTDVIVMGRLISARTATGMLAPAFSVLATHLGYQAVLRGALLAMAAGLWIIGSSSVVPQALVGMVLLGLGLTGFVPILQAYLSISLPYNKLARAIGMLEYSWALTGIVGLSLMGLLIAATGWRTPFFILGTGLVIMSFVFQTLPAVSDGRATLSASHPQPSETSLFARFIGFFHIETNAVSAYATILVGAINFYAAMQFMIIYGAWFADQYALGARELGFVALIFGCFDLTASVSVSLFTDRFGKRRSVLLGTTGALIGYLLIPWLNVAVVPALLSAALARGFFEFALVSGFPLLSGQSPNQTAKVMTLGSTVTLAASTASSFTTPLLYASIGITGLAIIAAICSVVALILLITSVREQPGVQLVE